MFGNKKRGRGRAAQSTRVKHQRRLLAENLETRRVMDVGFAAALDAPTAESNAIAFETADVAPGIGGIFGPGTIGTSQIDLDLVLPDDLPLHEADLVDSMGAAEVLRVAFGKPDDILPAAELRESLFEGDAAAVDPEGIASVWFERSVEAGELLAEITEECPPEHYGPGEDWELNPGDTMRVNLDGSVDIWRAKETEVPTGHVNVGDVLIDVLGQPDDQQPTSELIDFMMEGDLVRANTDGVASIWFDRGDFIAEYLHEISEECPPEHYEFGEEFELRPGDAMRVNPDASVDIWRHKESEDVILNPIPDRPQLEGDINLDGSVSLADFLILRENLGEAGSYEQGDLNRDGTVNFADFLTLQVNFGKKIVIEREDRDLDGKDDHTFVDFDGDGTFSTCEVDRDEDGKAEEVWRDGDDDGDWDSVHLDNDDDGQVDEIKLDTDGDGKFDYRWRDFDGDGEIDDGEHAPMFFPEPIDGPETP